MEQPFAPNARAVFDHALEIESPAQRLAYLAEACGGEPALRQQGDALLAAYEQAGSFLEAPMHGPSLAATVSPSATPLLEGAGSMIGPYKLLEQIGEGGMGT